MRCRACDGVLAPVVDLGAHPVGGRFPLVDDVLDTRLPLRLGACQSCGLAQLVDRSPPEADEPDSPSPMSSSTMSAHARGFVDDLIARGLATRSSRILSVASHGGHLAPFLAERGLSASILEGSPERASRLSGDSTRVVAGELDGRVPPGRLAPGSFDLVLDSYLLAHLERPRLALLRLSELLAPGGTLVMEFDHLLATVEGCQWDAVRHGHNAYLALTWLARELAAVGLDVVDAVPQPVYGGALRLYARAGAGVGMAVHSLLVRESAAAIDQPRGLAPLGTAVERARQEVVGHLRAARDAGRRVVGYGAPARSITFLNALGIGPDLLPYVVDRALAKQGRLIPGVRVPIRAPHVLGDDVPDEILILTWDLASEVRESLAIAVLADTRFIVAVPRLLDVTDMKAGSKRPLAERPVR
jgi:SAM-dependent methyltransferase